MLRARQGPSDFRFLFLESRFILTRLWGYRQAFISIQLPLAQRKQDLGEQVVRAGIPVLEAPPPIQSPKGLALAALGKTCPFTLNLLFLPGFQAYGNDRAEVQEGSAWPRKGSPLASGRELLWRERNTLEEKGGRPA